MRLHHRMRTMNETSKKIRKITYLGLALSIALICSYIEAMIPIPIGIPGIKLGLTNVVIVGILYYSGEGDAACISFLRVLLVGFLFGNWYSIIYSLAGAALSFVVMALLKKTNQFHLISVSAAGGIAHNLGQFLVVALMVENFHILYYFPVLLIAGMLTGILIGIVGYQVLIRLPKEEV